MGATLQIVGGLVQWILLTLGQAAPKLDVTGPTPVSGGSLLFFLHPDEARSCEDLMVVDPAEHPQARRFLSTPGNIQLLRRVSRGRVLAYSYPSSRKAPEGFFLLDLERGSAMPILPRAPFGCELVFTDGPRAFFLEHREKRSWTFGELDAGAAIPAPLRGAEKGVNEDLRFTDHFLLVDLNGDLSARPFFEGIVTYFSEDRGKFWVGIESPRLELWLLSPRSEDRRRVLDRFLGVLASDSRHLWVASGESGRSPDLWLVEREKVEALKLFALSPEWRLNALSFALSPSGRRVAIGVAREDDKPGERSLLVRDLETGRDLREFQGIVVGLEPVAGSEAALSFGWLDEERLRFSESGFSAEKFAAFLKATGEELVPGENQSPAYFQWVDVDVRDGKRSAEKVYARIWGLGGSMPRHHAPEVERGPAAQGGGAGGLTLKGGSGYHEPDGAAASAANRAFFRQESGRLYFADGEEIVEILDKNRVVSAEVEVSPDGAWAAIQDPQRRVWLVDGKTRRKHLLLQGWCNNFCWLGPSS